MTTVGYGNINPSTPNGQIFQIFSMILSCGTFTYIIGSMGKIISRNYDADTLFKEKILIINKFLYENGISDSLRFKIKMFLEYKLEMKVENKLEENEVLTMINKDLKEEIILEINLKLIDNFKYFNKFEAICVKISKILQGETIMKNELIFDVIIYDLINTINYPLKY